MATLAITVNKYVVLGGTVQTAAGSITLRIPDLDNDGTLCSRDLAAAFDVPNGHLLGNDRGFFVGATGNATNGKAPGTYYTRASLRAGDDIREVLKDLDQNFHGLRPDPAAPPAPSLAPQPSPAPCFAAGTMIETDRGAAAVEALRPGDLVRTRDAGLQPVRWIGARSVSAAELEANPKLRPIRIRAGALGAGTPAADLVVSPQHRILVRSKIAVRMFGAEEVLVAATQLLHLPGIDIATDMEAVTYVHFLCDGHQVVFSNGAETESLYTGPEALKAVGAAGREEILALFPQLRGRDALPVPARVLASGRMARRLAIRHADKARPLVG